MLSRSTRLRNILAAISANAEVRVEASDREDLPTTHTSV
jgi:hypothetical protein